MTASHTSGATRAKPASTTAGSALRDVLEATLHYVNGKLAQKTEGWVAELDDYEATRGSAEQAGYEGAKAELQGRNPIWASIKGAWAGASGPLKLAAVLFLVLVFVLAPVPTLLVLLGLLVAALIKAVQAADR
ncbi:MAG: hypothetical protein QOG01_2547 [Pseudonocardiales bacterium]|jgi:hypothetical protein|nr:hypothetical protein [Pseudonocardiales bacterium]